MCVSRVFLCVLALAVIATAATAAVPPMISYQGKLMQPNGTPVPDATYCIRFAIYDAPTEGDTLWSETNPSVQVKGGLFAVLLGSVNNLGPNILDSESRYLGIKVGSHEELSPRQRIASVATALRAGEADIARTVPDGAITTAKVAPAAITADKLAPGVAVPPGTILMWSGAVNAIPQGWVLCNGQNGTPDLRGRFVVGVGSGTYSASPVGVPFSYGSADTGGEASHQLTVAEMPSHQHSTYVQYFAFNYPGTAAASGHDQGAGDWGVTRPTGGSQPHESRPPYYALCFIMKLGY